MIATLCMSTLAASLLGSFHCAGMCGVFAAVATSNPTADRAERARLIAAYSAGRLVSYTTLGAMSGLLGEALNLSGNLAGVGNAAIILAASVVGFAGIVNLLRLMGVDVPRIPVPKPLLSTAMRAHRRVNSWTPFARSLAIGLLTTLLPCHWLYTFVATAAGTAHPLSGAAVMACFWLGTLPVMIATGTSITRCLGPLRTLVPVATSLLMVGAGAFTIYLRTAHHEPHSTLHGLSPALADSIPAFCNGTPSR